MSRKNILMSPADSKIYKFFERRFNVIDSEELIDFVPYERLHADMQALNINGKLFINGACKKLINRLKEQNTEFIICDNIGSKYPDNVALNVALVGRKLLCNEKALHPFVKKYCNNIGIQIIDVNQGYAKCSTLVLNDNTIITDDESIYKVSLINNINVLKIKKGDVYLDDSTVGFIGGASAKIGDTVYFFGDINSHRNADEIKGNIYGCGLKIECAPSSKLIDIGGAIILD